MKDDSRKLQAVFLHGKLLRATFSLRIVPRKTNLATLRELVESGTELPDAVLAGWEKLKPYYVEPEPNDYAQKASSGEVLVSKFVRQAAERFLDDIDHGDERGIFFDSEAAQHVLNFFTLLKQSKGEWAGRTLTLESWQQFITQNIFGWKKADGLRRFRTAHIEVARKNGKSTLLGGVGLYMLVADGEAGAEIYSAATAKEQARILFDASADMRDASSALTKLVGRVRNNLHFAQTKSKYQPLSSDYGTLDGLNVSAALCDEIHAWTSRSLWDVLATATAARRQPLMLAITTAGFSRESLCWKNRDYGTKVLAEILKDDSFFAFIACLDEGDDWEDEKNWPKANPNLRISVKIDDLRVKARQAAEEPTAFNDFMRLHLDTWVQQDVRWMPMAAWDKCSGIESNEDPKEARERWLEELRGSACFGGLDLSSTTDLTAYVLIFPPDGVRTKYRVLPWFFVPEDNIENRARKDRVPYPVWVRQGFITATPGNVVDYGFVRKTINETAAEFDLQKMGVDTWNARQLITELTEHDGIECEEFRQGFASMSAPTKSLMRLVLSCEIEHANNPVLRWNASNAVVVQDAAGNIKPDKSKATERIDGIVALIEAVGEADANPESSNSVYDRRGLLVL
jgi:phage terminase large subunit-like protein